MTLLFKDILAQGIYIPRALILTLLFIVVGIYPQMKASGNKWDSRELLEHWREVLFLFYLAFMLVSTLFSRKITNPYPNILKHLNTWDYFEWNNEIIGNILLFIPFTALFLQAFRVKNTWKSSFIVSIVTTSFIELSQLLFWLGEFQFADIINNTIGGMLGCCIWRIGMVMKYRIMKSKLER